MNLQKLFTGMEKYLRTAGYAESTIVRTKYSWNQFSLYCEKKEIAEFDFAIASQFSKEHYGVDFYKQGFLIQNKNVISFEFTKV